MQVKSKRKLRKPTTAIGYRNPNGQEVVRATGEKGTDANSYVYELRCSNCSNLYGANGTDIWQRKCPKCQGGKKGLTV